MKKTQKVILSALSLVTLGLIGTSGYTVYQEKFNVSYQELSNDLIMNQPEAANLDQVALLRDPDKKFNNVAILPLSKEKNKQENFMPQISKAADTFAKKNKLAKNDLLITTVAKEKSNLAIDTVTLKQTAYTYKDNKFSTGKNNTEKLVLSTKTHQPVTLKELFKNNERLGKFDLYLKQALLDNSSGKDSDVEKILAMPALSFDEKNYTVNDKGVTVTFDKEKSPVTSATVPFKVLTHTLDDSILAPEHKHVGKTKKQVALTFDDGPGPETTQQLLKTLKETNTHATFFMLGRNALNYPEIAKEVADGGHEIASHNYVHDLLTAADGKKATQQDRQADKAIYQATGVLPKIFRPPYGGINKEIADAIRKPMIQWDVDSSDWRLKEPNAIIKEIMKYVQDGSIILVHDIHKESVDAIPGLIKKLTAEGFEIVSLDDLSKTDFLPGSQYFSANDHRGITK